MVPFITPFFMDIYIYVYIYIYIYTPRSRVITPVTHLCHLNRGVTTPFITGDGAHLESFWANYLNFMSLNHWTSTPESWCNHPPFKDSSQLNPHVKFDNLHPWLDKSSRKRRLNHRKWIIFWFSSRGLLYITLKLTFSLLKINQWLEDEFPFWAPASWEEWISLLIRQKPCTPPKN